MAKALTTTGEQEKSGAQQGMQHVTGFVERTRSFLTDVRGEMRKVVTPSRAEVRTTTTVVIITVFAFAGFFYVVDSVLDHALRALLHSLGSTQ
jgi:preprotein translocase subunit SecE